MALFGSSKKEPASEAQPAAPAQTPAPSQEKATPPAPAATPAPLPVARALPADESQELPQLIGHLEKLRELFGQANRRIANYLSRRESQAPSAPATAPAPGIDVEGLRERLDCLAEAVQRLASVPSAAPAQAAAQPPAASEQALRDLAAELKEAVHTTVDQSIRAATQSAVRELDGTMKGLLADTPQRWAALDGAVRQVREQLEQGFQRLADLLASPPAEETPAEAPVSSSDWEQAILGAALAADPALAFDRQQFLGGILEGNAGACALAGQLLVFHSSPAERLPQLLKDIGEAYYRWQPKTKPGNTPMEEAIVRWLQKNCEAAGIYNVIELVHPGERFDSTRHAANSRGVEITEVLGWIVQRDNGKVYTKASVAVR